MVRTPLQPSGTTIKKEKKETTPIPVEKIYMNDLFDTYVPEVEVKPEQLSKLPTVPAGPAPITPLMPKATIPELLPQLGIKLRGIVLSSQAHQSVVLIEDETGKESRYFLGEKIKDGQLIKIASDCVILLRSNGQQDTYFLRSQSQKINPANPNRWSTIIKKINATRYTIDRDQIRKEVASFGQLIEDLSITTAFDNSTPIGLRVGALDKNNIGIALGLQEQDIITAIDNIPLSTLDDRIAAFSRLENAQLNDLITIKILRNNAETSISYSLKSIAQPAKGSGDKVEAEDLFNLRALDPRQTFEQEHAQKFDETAQEMRKRLLENMRLQRTDTRAR